jgi:hypothetical protein
MADDKIGTFGTGQAQWTIPETDKARQAIPPLRGYVYQLHRSMTAWIDLGEQDELYLEVAEDFAEVLKDPSRLDEVLNATQVKDTRESGSVTLNSGDVLDAISRLFYLGKEKPGREVFLTFLTTSPIGRERKNRLTSGRVGISVWQEKSSANVDELRAALALRFDQNELGDFIRNSSNDELQTRLLSRLFFACGEAGWQDVAAANRATLVGMRNEVSATEEMADRAYGVLLSGLIDTILSSGDRRLDRSTFLSSFRKATSLSLPSQTAVDLISRNVTGAAAAPPPLTEDRLREIARAMLEANVPPSIGKVVGAASAQAQAALDHLSSVQREISEDGRSDHSEDPILRTIEELVASSNLHNIVVGQPGSGKTQALWRTARSLLEKGEVIPIYLAAGSIRTWQVLRDSILDVAPAVDAAAVLHQPKVVVCIDGWAEFAVGENIAERSTAMRALHNVKVIANGRQRNASDSTFTSWTLQHITPSLVRETLMRAFGPSNQPDAKFIDLLRSPLLLSLYVLLGGSSVTRGELLRRLHDQVSKGMPDQFNDALFGAVAAMVLAGETHYSALLAGLRSRTRVVGLDNSIEFLQSLGTLTDRSGHVLPIHDLYWSWLAGMGFLRENLVQSALPDLESRESFTLAFESKERSTADMASASAPLDVVFAATLNTNCETPQTYRLLDQQLQEMLAADELAVRVRGATASLETGRSRYFRRSLDILSEVLAAGTYPLELISSLKPAALFRNRAALAEWLGALGTVEVLDVIARSGGPEWLGWLDEIQRGKLVDPELSLSIALACGGNIPVWGRAYLESLLEKEPWRLRTTADRAMNAELLKWVADRYENIVDRLLKPNSSGWLNLNRLLVTTGDDSVFNSLLDRFPSMSRKSQELLGFAVVERGEPWIGRFQEVAFRDQDINHHHRLAAELSLEIDDQMARGWIAAGHDAVGWRVLIARHGASMVPELIAGLPPSFDGLHHIPTLSAMSFLTDAPEALIDEIVSRIGGTMQPKAMQDVLEAISKVSLKGVPAIVKFCADRPGLLPAYHLAQAVRLYATWQKSSKMELVVATPVGQLPFREWALVGEYFRSKNEDFLPRGFSFAPDVAIRLVLSGLDIKYAKLVLDALEPLETLDQSLFEHMMVVPELTPIIPKLFAEVLDDMMSADLLLLAASTYVDFDNLLWRMSVTSNPMHRPFHLEAIAITLGKQINLHHFRYIGSMLRAYSRDDLQYLLLQFLTVRDDKVLWLIRMIEEVRRERLIDEAGTWIG